MATSSPWVRQLNEMIKAWGIPPGTPTLEKQKEDWDKAIQASALTGKIIPPRPDWGELLAEYSGQPTYQTQRDVISDIKWAAENMERMPSNIPPYAGSLTEYAGKALPAGQRAWKTLNLQERQVGVSAGNLALEREKWQYQKGQLDQLQQILSGGGPLTAYDTLLLAQNDMLEPYLQARAYEEQVNLANWLSKAGPERGRQFGDPNTGMYLAYLDWQAAAKSDKPEDMLSAADTAEFIDAVTRGNSNVVSLPIGPGGQQVQLQISPQIVQHYLAARRALASPVQQEKPVQVKSPYVSGSETKVNMVKQRMGGATR